MWLQQPGYAHAHALNHRCANAALGCTEVLTRAERAGHAASCRFKGKECANRCGATLILGPREAHERDVYARSGKLVKGELELADTHAPLCPGRRAICPLRCGSQSLTVQQIEDGSHVQVCPFVIESCEEGCGVRIARVYLTAHYDICPNKQACTLRVHVHVHVPVHVHVHVHGRSVPQLAGAPSSYHALAMATGPLPLRLRADAAAGGDDSARRGLRPAVR